MRRALAVVTAVVAAGAFGLLAVATIGVATDAWRIVPVRSGSMEPSIPTGAAAFARPVDVDDLDVGDVVVFHPPTDEEVLLVHRIAEVETVDGERAFRTKGDANDANDPWLVSFDDAELWRVERVVPLLGRLQASMSGMALRFGALVFGGALVLGVGLSAIWRRRDPEDPSGDVSDDDGAPDAGEGSADIPPPQWAPVAPRPGARRRRRRGRRKIPTGVGLLAALVAAVSLVPVHDALGAFSATTQADGEYSTGVLNAPSPLNCFWADFIGPNNQLVWPHWTNTSPDFAEEFRVFRSTASGGPYTHIGTVSAATLPLSVNSFTPKTQVHYYVVQAVRGPWTGPYSNEIATNQCRGAINAYAGVAPQGFSGDGGPATAAQFNEPTAIAFDSAGNGFIADASNNRIRRVDAATGVVTTFAGGVGAASACSYSGNVSGLRLNTPLGIAVDSLDNVYVADSLQSCIRRIDPSGNVSLFAGGGATTGCATSGPATSVGLAVPVGLAFDASGDLYVADAGNNCIRRFSGGTYSHVAGGGATAACTSSGPAGSVALALPVGVAVGPTGDVVIADAANNCVRRVSGGIYSHVLGGGATTSCWANGDATTIALNLPLGVAVDATNRVYVADSDHRCVRRVVGTGATGLAFTGALGAAGDNGPAYHALAGQPAALGFGPNGDLYIPDRLAGTVRRVVDPN